LILDLTSYNFYRKYIDDYVQNYDENY
jgi:hypothetical protein